MNNFLMDYLYTFSYMTSTATFAAPLPFQSGSNWLLNRVAVDSGIAGKAALQGIRDTVAAVRSKRPLVTRETLGQIPENFRALAKGRKEGLDLLDEAGNQRGLLKRMRSQSPMEAYANARKDVDFLPDVLADKRFKYNQAEPIGKLDMRKYR